MAHMHDVTIIGAGPAGSLAAAHCHKMGLDACVIERQRFPRFVIGESLLPRCADLMQDVDLLEPVLERGYLDKFGAEFRCGDQLGTFDFGQQFGDGYPQAWQVPRDDFDNLLITQVEERGVPVFWERSVTALERTTRGHRISWEDTDGTQGTTDTRFIIDASGYGRVLPRLLDLDRPTDMPPRGALFCHVDGDQQGSGRDRGHIWVCMHASGLWIWIIPFSDGRTSVGIVGALESIDRIIAENNGDLTQAWKSVVMGEENAAKRLANATPRMAPRLLRGYASHVDSLHGDGWCLTGNAGEFLDPVFSSGVTMAMEGGTLAAKCAARHLAGEEVDWDLEYDGTIQRAVSVFRTFIDAWYNGDFPTIIFAENPDSSIKEQICAVLAGYVLDDSNPFVARHRRKVPQLARILRAG